MSSLATDCLSAKRDWGTIFSMVINQESILKFISTSPTFEFRIPEYQRSYSWRVEQAEIFLDDLKRIIKNKGKHQFFGNMICESDHSSAVIIDGQQRITTILLMITAIYHLVKEYGQNRSSQPIETINDFLIQRHGASDKIRLKLRANTQDVEIFRQIYADDITDENKKSDLYEVYKSLLEGIRDSESEDFFEFIDALKYMEVALINLKEHDDSPQMIFESINSKGVELRLSDKIRNYSLFVKNDKLRETIYNDYWSKIENELTDVTDNQDDIDDFFKALVIKHFGHDIVNKELYRKFKDFFDDSVKPASPQHEKKVVAYYDSVMGDLQRYLFLRYGRDNNRVKYPKSIVDQNRRVIQAENWATLPFLMTILEKYEEEECDAKQVQNVLQALEVLLVRRYICKEPANVLHKNLYSLHNRIEERLDDKTGAFKNYIEVYRDEIRKLTPTDEKVQFAVKTIDYKAKPRILKLILSSYDDYQSKESNLLHQLDELTIEHVMPQTPSPEWENFFGEDYERVHGEYLDKLANLTLSGYNSEYSNKSFEEKLNMKNGFKDSPLYINDFIKEQKTWAEAVLKKREAWWVEQINEIWKYSGVKQHSALIS